MQQITSVSMKLPILSPLNSAKYFSSMKIVSPPVIKTSKVDVDSISITHGFIEDFLTIFEEKLHLLDADRKEFGSTIKGALDYYDTVLESLQKLLEETNDEHTAMYEEELAGFGNSKGIIWGCQLVRNDINKRLLYLYNKVLRQLRSIFVQIFQSQLLKLSPFVYSELKKQITREYQLRLQLLLAGIIRFRMLQLI
jgi:hypothetical protein